MTVIVLTNVKPSVRGELTRWMVEPKPGVFIGRVSAMVRDRLWMRIRRSTGADASAILLYAHDNEQGYQIDLIGRGTRVVRDFDGLSLVARVREEPEI